jgi:hypothetical protein
MKPIIVAVLSKTRNVFARSNTEIVGSNPTRGMDVCLRFPRVCFVVCMWRPWEGLIPVQESYHLSIRFIISLINSEWEQVREPNPSRYKKKKRNSRFFFNLYNGGWNQGPLDTAATNGLLCQPRVIMMMEKSVE